MSDFWEREVAEYPPIKRTKTWKKDVKLRVRVLFRNLDGIPKKIVDIREHVMSEKGSYFTAKAVYFTKEELSQMITTLTTIWKEHFGKGAMNNDPGRGSREANHSSIKKEKELF